MKFPGDIKYTKDHEWAKESGGKIIVGITAFAVEQLGDITLVDLPAVGSTATVGQSFGTIESVKSVSDLYAPVSGKVVKINEELAQKPEFINESPYEKGWLVEIEPTEKLPDTLMSAEAYTKLVAEQ